MNRYLPATPPFSLSAVVESHGWWQLPPFSWDASAGLLTRVEQLSSGRVVKLFVREGDDGVIVEAGEELTAAGEITEKVGWMLQLSQDFSEFYALAQDEPHLADVMRSAKGRILRSPTLFEDVVKTVLTTNVQWSGTIRMTESLVDQFGPSLPGDRSQCAFPTPDALADAGESSLRAAGLGYRAPYVLDLAHSVVSGARDLEALSDKGLPSEEVHRRLLAITGVGEYAAASIMMLLGHYAFLPVDSWARTMVSREWYGGEPVGRAEVESAFEAWGSWKGLAYWFWNWSAA